MPLIASISSKNHSLFIGMFILLICGAIALPMLPVWQAGVRLLAGLILIMCLSKFKVPVLLALLSLSMVALAGWFNNLLVHPAGHVIHSLMDVYGLAMSWKTDLALVLYDIICLLALAVILLRSLWPVQKVTAVFVLSLMLFWFGALLQPVWVLFSVRSASSLPQMLTGASTWAGWVYWSLIALCLVRDRSDFEMLLKSAGLGVIIVALIVTVQWLVGDYSYVIDAPNFKHYFYRVRGTYYYHTAVTFILVIGIAILLTLLSFKRNSAIWLACAILLLFFLVDVNNTRAMSLSLLAGMVVAAVLALKNKHYLILFLSVLGCFMSLQNITYLKPTRNIQPAQELAISSQENPEQEADKSLVSANSSRTQLALQGISIIPAYFWTGSGIGTLDLPLPGNSFNGIHSTYSSHTLYLDVLLMAGIFSFLGFCLVFSIGLWRALLNAYSSGLSNPNNLYIGLSAILVIFLVGSFFLPQERNETIGMAFLFASLAVLRPVDNGKKKIHFSFCRIFSVVIAVSAFFWSVLTSPSYVFPAIEFAARYADQNEKIYVNQPAVKPLLEWLLRVTGKGSVQIDVLADDPEQLPEHGSWIIWNPGQDKRYPVLRETLGYQSVLRDGHEPSLVLQNSWWIVPSSQPVTSFIFVGSRAQIAVPLKEVADIVVNNTIELVKSEKNGEPSIYKVLNNQIKLNLVYSTQLPEPDFISIKTARTEEKNVITYTMKLSDIKVNNNEYIITGGKIVPGTLVVFEAFFSSYPNNAYNAEITIQAGNKNGQMIADKNFGSGVMLESESDTVLFDFAHQKIPPVGIYRMVASHNSLTVNRHLYSWDVLASYNNIDWFKLETRQNIYLSQDSQAPSTFVLNNREAYSFYKFRFHPAPEKGVQSGIMELELYPVP